MKLAEITITLSVPREVDDRETERMVEAYEELGLPYILYCVAEDHINSRTALQDVRITINES